VLLRGTAFGLDVESEIPLSFLEGSSATPTGRTVALSVRSEEEARRDWPATTELICDERHPDGTIVFQIEAHPQAGYLISGPRYGTYLMSLDGREVVCAAGDRPDPAWQRLLIAQVLPFAALLCGLEIFHASAVVRGDEAVAFLGPSRAGKTSLALELCRRGALFLADDVLALEQRGKQLLAHPGTPLAGVDRVEGQARRDVREKTVTADAKEWLVPMPGPALPTRLAALFFLDRRKDGPTQPSFEPATEALALLTSTFNFVLRTPRRLQGLLDVCALAAQLRVERINAGPATSAADLGAAVERRLSSPV
jgi:hypothetical protein